MRRTGQCKNIGSPQDSPNRLDVVSVDVNNHNSNVLFYVLFLQIGAHCKMKNKTQSAQTYVSMHTHTGTRMHSV